jgi:ABC-2 type transport system ATP-binding protein
LLADVQDVSDRITILFRGKKMVEDEVRELVQIRDVTQVQATGLTPAQISELRQYLERTGATGVEVTHPTTSLEDLFIRIVRENTPEGGTSVGSGPTR